MKVKWKNFCCVIITSKGLSNCLGLGLQNSQNLFWLSKKCILTLKASTPHGCFQTRHRYQILKVNYKIGKNKTFLGFCLDVEKSGTKISQWGCSLAWALELPKLKTQWKIFLNFWNILNHIFKTSKAILGKQNPFLFKTGNSKMKTVRNGVFMSLVPHQFGRVKLWISNFDIWCCFLQASGVEK